MGNLEVLTVFVVAVNCIMFLCAQGMALVNPSGDVCYHYEGTFLEQEVTKNNDTYVAQNDVLNDLPGAAGSVSPSASSIFTDIFNSILGYIKKTPGVSYAYFVVAAPYNILNCMHLPSAFIATIGAFWYAVSLLVLLSYLWWR